MTTSDEAVESSVVPCILVALNTLVVCACWYCQTPTMAEAPPLESGALPETREACGEMEAMEVEASLLAFSLLSGGEEGEVHSTDELFREPVLQAIFSANAKAEVHSWM